MVPPKSRLVLWVVLVVLPVSVQGYVLKAPWRSATLPVTVAYYINPQNSYGFTLAQLQQVTAFAAQQWTDATHGRLVYTYAGTTTKSAVHAVTHPDGTITWENVCDGVNVVAFEHTRKIALLAEAISCYEYRNGVRYRKTDTDIPIYEVTSGGTRRPFMIGDGVCDPKAWHLEDVLTHEWGHFTGLSHVSLSRATMYKSTGACTTNWRTLDADDINGAQALYGQ